MESAAATSSPYSAKSRLMNNDLAEYENLRSSKLATDMDSQDHPRNNAAMLSDTHPEAELVLIELWRRKTPAERFARVGELTEMTRRNAKRAIQRSLPEASPEEVGLRFIELHYGRDLAGRVREYLKGQSA